MNLHGCRHRLFAIGRPFSPLYSLIMVLRTSFYQRGLLRIRKVARPVISIGNLSLGGTGKTPHVMALAKWLLSKGLRPAVVSRGYGGRAGVGPLVVSDGENLFCDAAISGDEPYMMAQALKGLVVVAGSNRVECAREAISRFGATTIILDDGFQHLRLHRDVDILLLPAKAPLGNGRVFPGGELREPPSAMKRATCIILSKCEEVEFNKLELLREKVHHLAGNRPVFFSRTEFQGVRLAGNREFLKFPLPSPVYCFCGIAGPDSFVSMVEKQGMIINGKSFFPDHGPISTEDLLRIFEAAKKTGAKLVLTTAKDYARIRPKWLAISRDRTDILPLGIVEIKARPDETFWKMLESRIS